MQFRSKCFFRVEEEGVGKMKGKETQRESGNFDAVIRGYFSAHNLATATGVPGFWNSWRVRGVSHIPLWGLLTRRIRLSLIELTYLQTKNPISQACAGG